MLQEKEINKDLLRFSTAGSVDDGKSTLIGRLLFDSNNIYDDQLESILKVSKQKGNSEVDLSLLTDGLRAEREQGITIDVAYRYFSTEKRKFIIADCPGHVQYTRNMITGCSNSNLLLLLIDAKKGVLEQTRRHAFIASMLKIKHLIICINKMDSVGYDETIFDKIREEFLHFASKLSVPDIQFIPISALKGDNIVKQSTQMLWYKGPSLLYTLEHVVVTADYNHIDCRFPVQTVLRPQSQEFSEYRGYAGRIEGGVFKKGDQIMVLPSGFTATIKSIYSAGKELAEAYSPMSVDMTLNEQIDIGRGDMLVKPNNQPSISQDLEVMICWMSERKLLPGEKFILRHTTAELKCIVKEIRYKINIHTLHRAEDNSELLQNDIGRVLLRVTKPVCYDTYAKNKNTGSLILLDEFNFDTVAAGMII